MNIKAIVILLAGIFGIIVLYLLFWPVPIDPVAWTPPEAPELKGGDVD